MRLTETYTVPSHNWEQDIELIRFDSKFKLLQQAIYVKFENIINKFKKTTKPDEFTHPEKIELFFQNINKYHSDTVFEHLKYLFRIDESWSLIAKILCNNLNLDTEITNFMLIQLLHKTEVSSLLLEIINNTKWLTQYNAKNLLYKSIELNLSLIPEVDIIDLIKVIIWWIQSNKDLISWNWKFDFDLSEQLLIRIINCANKWYIYSEILLNYDILKILLKESDNLDKTILRELLRDWETNAIKKLYREGKWILDEKDYILVSQTLDWRQKEHQENLDNAKK